MRSKTREAFKSAANKAGCTEELECQQSEGGGACPVLHGHQFLETGLATETHLEGGPEGGLCRAAAAAAALAAARSHVPSLPRLPR
jgi:hypothetical protein